MSPAAVWSVGAVAVGVVGFAIGWGEWMADRDLPKVEEARSPDDQAIAIGELMAALVLARARLGLPLLISVLRRQLLRAEIADRGGQDRFGW